MRRPPAHIDGCEVLRFADVSGSTVTGRTRHVVQGGQVTEFTGLAIAQAPSDPGYYLLYCDENWQTITDTYHETIDAAIAQAEFEFDPVVFVDTGSLS
jgi:hypothetical protein